MSMKDAYFEHKRRTWKLRDPTDPKQVETDIKSYWNDQVGLALAWFAQEYGYTPQGNIPPPCLMNVREDVREELFHSQQDRDIMFRFIENLKSGRSMPYHLGGLGYVLQGVPWDKIPEWAQVSIMQYKE